MYDNFEKEFGRTLSPMEYEIINNWKEQKISNELILAASFASSKWIASLLLSKTPLVTPYPPVLQQ